jgi:crossover junction endodeoxyribonuclease RuvC
MLVIGIDPGTRSTGYGIVRIDGAQITCVEYGAIHNVARLSVWECHVRIYDGIAKLTQEYAINAAAVESQFFFKNALAVLRIGEARSAAMLPLTRAGVPIAEYAPRRVKQAVVGHGSATKPQVAAMVMTLLKLRVPIEPEDASDALAIALCHAHTRRIEERMP